MNPYKKTPYWNRLQTQRLHQLEEIFNEYNYEIKSYGDQYLYVKYGKPSLEEVVESQIQEREQYQKRRLQLTEILLERGILYDEAYSSCSDYVYQRTHQTLEEAALAIEVEDFLRKKTAYLSLLPSLGKQRAQEIALRQYCYPKSHKSKERINIPERLDLVNPMRICFE